jgi:hypothetical protein
MLLNSAVVNTATINGSVGGATHSLSSVVACASSATSAVLITKVIGTNSLSSSQATGVFLLNNPLNAAAVSNVLATPALNKIAPISSSVSVVCSNIAQNLVHIVNLDSGFTTGPLNNTLLNSYAINEGVTTASVRVSATGFVIPVSVLTGSASAVSSGTGLLNKVDVLASSSTGYVSSFAQLFDIIPLASLAGTASITNVVTANTSVAYKVSSLAASESSVAGLMAKVAPIGANAYSASSVSALFTKTIPLASSVVANSNTQANLATQVTLNSGFSTGVLNVGLVNRLPLNGGTTTATVESRAFGDYLLANALQGACTATSSASAGLVTDKLLSANAVSNVSTALTFNLNIALSNILLRSVLNSSVINTGAINANDSLVASSNATAIGAISKSATVISGSAVASNSAVGLLNTSYGLEAQAQSSVTSGLSFNLVIELSSANRNSVLDGTTLNTNAVNATLPPNSSAVSIASGSLQANTRLLAGSVSVNASATASVQNGVNLSGSLVCRSFIYDIPIVPSPIILASAVQSRSSASGYIADIIPLNGIAPARSSFIGFINYNPVFGTAPVVASINGKLHYTRFSDEPIDSLAIQWLDGSIHVSVEANRIYATAEKLDFYIYKNAA